MTKRRRLDKSEVTDSTSAFDLFGQSIKRALEVDIFDAGVTRSVWYSWWRYLWIR